MTPLKPFVTLRDSFRGKVFALTLSFVIVLSILFPAFFIPYEIRDSRAALVREGTILANLLAFHSRLPIFSENLALIDEAADSMLIHKDILSVAIYTPDGRKLLEELPGEQHLPLADNPEERKQVAERARTLTKVTYEERPEGIEFWAPVRIVPGYASDEDLYFGGEESARKEQTVGVVRLILSTKELRETINLLIGISISLALLFILIGTLLAYRVAQGMTAPLKRLATGVAALGVEGKLREVPVETRDEVGQVADAFNSLIDSLRKRESEKAFLEEQLRHAQKMEAVGTLAGGIAHDFNTILTAIIGFTDLLQKEAGDLPEVRQYVRKIRKSSGKASQLITRLLAFSRKQVINPRPTDLNSVIREMEELLQRVVTDAVVLELVLDPEPLPVLLDADQFDQVMLNLATNARDAMPGGGTFRITTRRTPACESPCGRNDHPHPGWCAVVTVTDTGQGLPDDIREKIFDPFFTTKEVGKGTGLGLSMAYGIIRQHSGDIIAKGEQGVGTTFTICLPGLHPCLLGEENTDIEGLRVVMVDADPVMRHQAGQLLRECGASVREAEESMEAIRLCRDPGEPVDVVLIDILMPGAKSAYEEIRMTAPHVRFIFIGGMRRKGQAEDDAMDAGITTIYRPLDETELLAKFMKVIGREAAG